MNETTFIYALKDPDTGIIRYIGKANNPVLRWVGHSKQATRRNGRAPVCHWIRKLHALGKIPSLEVLDEVPRSEWEFWEREYIRLFRAIAVRPLLNVSEGGDGGITFGFQGHKHTSAARRKMSLALAGEKHPNWGKPLPEETRKKISLANQGNKNTLGLKHSPESCEKHRLVALGNQHFLGKSHSEATREKLRQINLGKKATVAAKENMRRAHLGIPLAEATKEKMRISQQARRKKERLA